jgi:membrane protein involved in D-alanine export
MVPYSDFYYFYILSLILIPAVCLGILGKPIRNYGLLATAFIFFLIFTKKYEIYFVLVFSAVQIFLAYTFLFLCKYRRNVALLWLYIVLSILPLIVCKFSPFFQINNLGFLGISYTTFKSLEILISIYDKRINSLNLADYLYFLFFFPTLTSGPINRFRGFFEDTCRTLPVKKYIEILGEGIWKVFLGLGYKFIIAVNIDSLILEKIHDSHSLLGHLQYMYAYSMYLFFDFAGYSLIAIGVSYILGVNTPENFSSPFLSRDVKDFWNRWHMSLSFWFRDYVFNKFVMFALKKKLFKNKLAISSTGYLLTMTTMGLWHGPHLRYIVYGMYHGLLLCLTDLFMHTSWFKRNSSKKLFEYASTFITFNLICFGFLIFSGHLF